MTTQTTDDAREFSRRMNLPGTTVRYVDGGPRCQDVCLSNRGTDYGTKSLSYKRGKVVSTLYVLPTIEQEG